MNTTMEKQAKQIGWNAVANILDLQCEVRGPFATKEEAEAVAATMGPMATVERAVEVDDSYLDSEQP